MGGFSGYYLSEFGSKIVMGENVGIQEDDVDSTTSIVVSSDFVLGECKFHGQISAVLYPFLLCALITKYCAASSCSDIRVTGTLQLHLWFQCVVHQICSFETLL